MEECCCPSQNSSFYLMRSWSCPQTLVKMIIMNIVTAIVAIRAKGSAYSLSMLEPPSSLAN